MGIYIKGMKMPKDGETITITICDDGIVFEEWKEPGSVFEAIPVPPHGRLIDADALAAEMKKRQTEAGKWLREAKDHDTAVRADAVLSFLCEVKLTLDKMPTIIEAEGGDAQ